MKTIVTATEARGNFFNLLNRVLYGGETIFITKSGADELVKVESVSDSKALLAQLAGSISDKEATTMKEAIRKAKKAHPRNISSW